MEHSSMRLDYSKLHKIKNWEPDMGVGEVFKPEKLETIDPVFSGNDKILPQQFIRKAVALWKDKYLGLDTDIDPLNIDPTGKKTFGGFIIPLEWFRAEALQCKISTKELKKLLGFESNSTRIGRGEPKSDKYKVDYNGEIVIGNSGTGYLRPHKDYVDNKILNCWSWFGWKLDNFTHPDYPDDRLFFRETIFLVTIKDATGAVTEFLCGSFGEQFSKLEIIDRDEVPNLYEFSGKLFNPITAGGPVNPGGWLEAKLLVREGCLDGDFDIANVAVINGEFSCMTEVEIRVPQSLFMKKPLDFDSIDYELPGDIELPEDGLGLVDPEFSGKGYSRIAFIRNAFYNYKNNIFDLGKMNIHEELPLYCMETLFSSFNSHLIPFDYFREEVLLNKINKKALRVLLNLDERYSVYPYSVNAYEFLTQEEHSSAEQNYTISYTQRKTYYGARNNLKFSIKSDGGAFTNSNEDNVINLSRSPVHYMLRFEFNEDPVTGETREPLEFLGYSAPHLFGPYEKVSNVTQDRFFEEYKKAKSENSSFFVEFPGGKHPELSVQEKQKYKDTDILNIRLKNVKKVVVVICKARLFLDFDLVKNIGEDFVYPEITEARGDTRFAFIRNMFHSFENNKFYLDKVPWTIHDLDFRDEEPRTFERFLIPSEYFRNTILGGRFNRRQLNVLLNVDKDTRLYKSSVFTKDRLEIYEIETTSKSSVEQTYNIKALFSDSYNPYCILNLSSSGGAIDKLHKLEFNKVGFDYEDFYLIRFEFNEDPTTGETREPLEFFGQMLGLGYGDKEIEEGETHFSISRGFKDIPILGVQAFDAVKKELESEGSAFIVQLANKGYRDPIGEGSLLSLKLKNVKKITVIRDQEAIDSLKYEDVKDLEDYKDETPPVVETPEDSEENKKKNYYPFQFIRNSFANYNRGLLGFKNTPIGDYDKRGSDGSFNLVELSFGTFLFPFEYFKETILGGKYNRTQLRRILGLYSGVSGGAWGDSVIKTIVNKNPNEGEEKLSLYCFSESNTTFQLINHSRTINEVLYSDGRNYMLIQIECMNGEKQEYLFGGGRVYETGDLISGYSAIENKAIIRGEIKRLRENNKAMFFETGNNSPEFNIEQGTDLLGIEVAVKQINIIYPNNNNRNIDFEAIQGIEEEVEKPIEPPKEPEVVCLDLGLVRNALASYDNSKFGFSKFNWDGSEITGQLDKNAKSFILPIGYLCNDIFGGKYTQEQIKKLFNLDPNSNLYAEKPVVKEFTPPRPCPILAGPNSSGYWYISNEPLDDHKIDYENEMPEWYDVITQIDGHTFLIKLEAENGTIHELVCYYNTAYRNFGDVINSSFGATISNELKQASAKYGNMRTFLECKVYGSLESEFQFSQESRYQNDVLKLKSNFKKITFIINPIKNMNLAFDKLGLQNPAKPPLDVTKPENIKSKFNQESFKSFGSYPKFNELTEISPHFKNKNDIDVFIRNAIALYNNKEVGLTQLREPATGQAYTNYILSLDFFCNVILGGARGVSWFKKAIYLAEKPYQNIIEPNSNTLEIGFDKDNQITLNGKNIGVKGYCIILITAVTEDGEAVDYIANSLSNRDTRDGKVARYYEPMTQAQENAINNITAKLRSIASGPVFDSYFENRKSASSYPVGTKVKVTPFGSTKISKILVRRLYESSTGPGYSSTLINTTLLPSSGESPVVGLPEPEKTYTPIFTEDSFKTLRPYPRFGEVIKAHKGVKSGALDYHKTRQVYDGELPELIRAVVSVYNNSELGIPKYENLYDYLNRSIRENDTSPVSFSNFIIPLDVLSNVFFGGSRSSTWFKNQIAPYCDETIIEPDSNTLEIGFDRTITKVNGENISVSPSYAKTITIVSAISENDEIVDYICFNMSGAHKNEETKRNCVEMSQEQMTNIANLKSKLANINPALGMFLESREFGKYVSFYPNGTYLTATPFGSTKIKKIIVRSRVNNADKIKINGWEHNIHKFNYIEPIPDQEQWEDPQPFDPNTPPEPQVPGEGVDYHHIYPVSVELIEGKLADISPEFTGSGKMYVEVFIRKALALFGDEYFGFDKNIVNNDYYSTKYKTFNSFLFPLQWFREIVLKGKVSTVGLKSMLGLGAGASRYTYTGSQNKLQVGYTGSYDYKNITGFVSSISLYWKLFLIRAITSSGKYVEYLGGSYDGYPAKLVDSSVVERCEKIRKQLKGKKEEQSFWLQLTGGNPNFGLNTSPLQIDDSIGGEKIVKVEVIYTGYGWYVDFNKQTDTTFDPITLPPTGGSSGGNPAFIKSPVISKPVPYKFQGSTSSWYSNYGRLVQSKHGFAPGYSDPNTLGRFVMSPDDMCKLLVIPNKQTLWYCITNGIEVGQTEQTHSSSGFGYGFKCFNEYVSSISVIQKANNQRSCTISITTSKGNSEIEAGTTSYGYLTYIRFIFEGNEIYELCLLDQEGRCTYTQSKNSVMQSNYPSFQNNTDYKSDNKFYKLWKGSSYLNTSTLNKKLLKVEWVSRNNDSGLYF